MSDIKKIKDQYIDKLNKDLRVENITKIKSELFGKNGEISNLFKKLASLAPNERKKFSSDLNSVKEVLQKK